MTAGSGPRTTNLCESQARRTQPRRGGRDHCTAPPCRCANAADGVPCAQAGRHTRTGRTDMAGLRGGSRSPDPLSVRFGTDRVVTPWPTINPAPRDQFAAGRRIARNRRRVIRIDRERPLDLRFTSIWLRSNASSRSVLYQWPFAMTGAPVHVMPHRQKNDGHGEEAVLRIRS